MRNFTKSLVFVFCLFFTGNLMAQTIISYTTTDGLPDNFINGGITFSSNGHVWCGTSSGVAEYNGTAWTAYHIADGIADDYITCIAADQIGNVWVGTDLGVSRYNGTSWQTFTTADGLVDNMVSSIACEADGTVWFGTLSGVSKYDGTTWTTFNTGNGFPTNLITTIYIDDTGNKWFGSWENGVIKYDGANYTQIDTLDGLFSQYITSIAVDQTGNLYAGTLYGISVFNSSLVWTDSLNGSDGLYNNYIMDIDFAPDGDLWVSMFVDYLVDGGVTWVDGNTYKSFNTADGIADPLVKKIAIDSEGSVWVATGNGLSKIYNFNGISERLQNSKIFYPNPTSGIIMFTNTFTSIVITDMNGITVYSSDNVSVTDVSELPSGIYYVTVTDRDGKINRNKLCIAR